MTLYEYYEQQRKGQNTSIQLPEDLTDGLAYPLREYQKEALDNLVRHYTEHKANLNARHLLFHMATGSGKTLVMAGALLYFYMQGYRRFLFCSNQNVIVAKTRYNLIRPSAKYLFSDPLQLDGQMIRIEEVASFRDGSSHLQMVVTTIQALHEALRTPKENSAFTQAALAKEKMVILADEAHHFQVKSKGKKAKEEANWESSIEQLLGAHSENYLLEFTATMPEYLDKYKDKKLYFYPFERYRQSGYSKEVYSLTSDVSVKDRILQALVLSQYRQARASAHGVIGAVLKPVILFKAKQIAPKKIQGVLSEGSVEDRCMSAEGAYTYFVEQFWDEVAVADLPRLKAHWQEVSAKTNSEYLFTGTTSSTLLEAFGYFEENGGWAELIAQLRRDFDKAHCRYLHSEKKDGASITAELNRLDEADNSIRAIFAVDMLNEGWDVLNLFDIVRLYASKGSGGQHATQEAQLIGRGARYCPFRLAQPDEPDEPEFKYKRKFDQEPSHALRACEQLYYHCKEESKFIRQLNQALVEEGIKEEEKPQVKLCLSEAFKESPLYQKGVIYLNKAQNCRADIPAALQAFRYTHTLIQEQERAISDSKDPTTSTRLRVSELGYAVLRTAIQRTQGLHFVRLSQRYTKKDAPNSMKEFIENLYQLKDITVEGHANPLSADQKLAIAQGFISQVLHTITTKAFQKKGTPFTERKAIKAVFKDQHPLRTNNPEFPTWDEKGIFAYEELYPTAEEKAFLKLFKGLLPKLEAKHKRIHLLRSERFFKLYNFKDGKAFEPDFVLFAIRPNGEQLLLQCFIEPKGQHLMEYDKWKENYLTSIHEPPQIREINGIPTQIIGLPFYNSQDEDTFINAFYEAFNLKKR